MKAAWVEKYSNEKNTGLVFYKKLYLKEEGVLRIAAPSAFKVFINGEFVYAGTKRVAEGFVALNTIPLPVGEIDLCVEAVNYGIFSFEYIKQTPFVGIEVKEGETTVATVFDFVCWLNRARIQKVERYSCQRNFLECYQYDFDPCDLHRGKVSWEKEKLTEVPIFELMDSCGYVPTLEEYKIDNEVDRGKIHIKKEFFDEIIPPYARVTNSALGYFDNELDVRVSSEASQIGFISENTPGDEISEGYRTYMLAEEKTGFFEIQLEAEECSELFLIFDEIIPSVEELEKISGGFSFLGDQYPIAFNRQTSVNALKYSFLKKGRYALSSFEPYSFKFLKVAVKGKVKISQFSLRLCENGEVKADFLLNNKDAAAVMDSAINTFKQNVLDIFMDCPSRERAGWLCDSFFIARAEKLLTGKNSVEKVFLTNYLIAPPCKNLPPEMFPMCYPSDFSNGNYIPNWALWLVIELFDYVQRTEEWETALAFQKKLYDLFGFFQKYENEYGLLESLDKWIFVEWSDSNKYVRDVSYPTNMLYGSALIAAGKMYDDPKLIEKGQKIREEVVRQSFNGEFFLDHACRVNGKLEIMPQATETCQYYAIFFGLTKGELFKAFEEKMVYSFGDRERKEYLEIAPSNMFIGKFLRLEILKNMGLKKKLYEECISTFAYMAGQTGTLWENIGATASCNHGFTSYAANLLLSALTGYDGRNDRKKELYFSSFYAPFDLEVKLPLADDKFVEISVKDGVRHVFAEGYEETSKNA